MQRGAHFAIFDVPCGAPCWAQRGHQKRYKNNAFLLIFHMPMCDLSDTSVAFAFAIASVKGRIIGDPALSTLEGKVEELTKIRNFLSMFLGGPMSLIFLGGPMSQ